MNKSIQVSDLTLAFVIRYKTHFLSTWKTKQDNSTNYVLTNKTIRRNDVPMLEKTKRIAQLKAQTHSSHIQRDNT